MIDCGASRDDYWTLSYPAAIEFGAIAFGIFVVFAHCDGEVVMPGEIFLGTHIQIVVMTIIENGIDGFDRRGADRSGGQTFIHVCIVW